VLSGDEDVVDPHWLNIHAFVGIFDDYLGLQVRSEPGDGSAVSSFANLLT